MFVSLKKHTETQLGLSKPLFLYWFILILERSFAGVAQSVEQFIRNEKVGGSIPLSGTIRLFTHP